MTRHEIVRYSRLGQNDLTRMRQLMGVYAEVFDDRDAYASKPASDQYLTRLLAKPDFITIVAEVECKVIGGLSAYLLEKFEQERSEVYIYDLAVCGKFRRRGIATNLIRELQAVATKLNVWVIYVQADLGDDPAIKLYSSLGNREDVLHFDIPVKLYDN